MVAFPDSERRQERRFNRKGVVMNIHREIVIFPSGVALGKYDFSRVNKSSYPQALVSFHGKIDDQCISKGIDTRSSHG